MIHAIIITTHNSIRQLLDVFYTKLQASDMCYVRDIHAISDTSVATVN